MQGLLRIDGTVYRFLGASYSGVDGTSVARQVSREVTPLATIYAFEAAGISLELSFIGVAFALDTDIFAAARPLTHLKLVVTATDGRAHDVEVYLDQTAGVAVSDMGQAIVWDRPRSETLEVMRVGTVAQRRLSQEDRISWGYAMIATPRCAGAHSVMAGADALRRAFAQGAYFETRDEAPKPRALADRALALSLGWSLGRVRLGAQRSAMLAYDQVVSMRYFGTEMPPLWRQRWGSVVEMLEDSETRRREDWVAAAAFDLAMVANLTRAGGSEYATVCSLAYRQTIGATQAVWNPVLQKPWVFMKEISSDGDINTVDVLSPASPLFLYLYPEYLRLMLEPLLVYAGNGTEKYGAFVPYTLPWAPHDLGTWPVADLPPRSQEQMPIEESGNMIIALAALGRRLGSRSLLDAYWPLLETWAQFINASLPDPGDQLCTDDFEGPSPHNVNLAAKGIVALAAFAGLLAEQGNASEALLYKERCQALASEWAHNANDGDHFRLQFDMKGSWSQKYNLVWQRVLSVHAFPDDVIEKDFAFYMKKMDRCGVPLDGRHAFTTVDHMLFTASLGPPSDFATVMDAVFRYINGTPDRVPMSDWYDTNTCGRQTFLRGAGFRARPVLGGVFIKALIHDGALLSGQAPPQLRADPHLVAAFV